MPAPAPGSALPVPLGGKHSCQEASPSTVANPGPQGEQEPRGALRGDAFSKKTSASAQSREGTRQCKYNETPERERRLNAPAAAACLARPGLHCPLAATRGPGGRFNPRAGAGRITGLGVCGKPDALSPPCGHRPGAASPSALPAVSNSPSFAFISITKQLRNADCRRSQCTLATFLETGWYLIYR